MKNNETIHSSFEHRELDCSDMHAIIETANDAPIGVQVTLWARLQDEVFPNVYIKQSKGWIDTFGYLHPASSIFVKMVETLSVGGFEVMLVFDPVNQ